MKFFYTTLVLVLFFINSINAQSDSGKWIFEAGVNTVDIRSYTKNLGDNLGDYFSSSDWNSGFKIAAERFINHNLSIQLAGSFNKVKTIVAKNDSDESFFSSDVNVKYYLNDLFLKADWFNPYILGGTGYQSVGDEENLMLGGAIGVNFWLNDQFGLNVQTGYKHGFISNGRDVFQHSIGLIFTFGKVSSGGRIWGN